MLLVRLVGPGSHRPLPLGTAPSSRHKEHTEAELTVTSSSGWGAPCSFYHYASWLTPRRNIISSSIQYYIIKNKNEFPVDHPLTDFS